MGKQTLIENKVREATQERHKRSGTKTAKINGTKRTKANGAQKLKQKQRCASASRRLAGTLARAEAEAFGRLPGPGLAARL